MFVLDPNEVLSAEEGYLVILATRLVDFTWFLTILVLFSKKTCNKNYWLKFQDLHHELIIFFMKTHNFFIKNRIMIQKNLKFLL